MISNFCLLSGVDIPFPEAQVTIHQPTLKEIAFLGEEKCFIGCGLLNFSKSLLDTKDKTYLEQYTDFDILLTMFLNKDIDKDAKDSINCGILVLTILFPKYVVKFSKKGIELIDGDNIHYLDNSNFLVFKSIIAQMFNLSGFDSSDGANPQGSLAKKIAEKLKERHKRLVAEKGSKNQDIFGRYASILSIGMSIDINVIYQYTIYQIYDAFKRFNAKRAYENFFKAKLAGAKDLQTVEDWESDLLDDEDKKIIKNK
jgi:hypothetical protein